MLMCLSHPHFLKERRHVECLTVGSTFTNDGVWPVTSSGLPLKSLQRERFARFPFRILESLPEAPL